MHALRTLALLALTVAAHAQAEPVRHTVQHEGAEREYYVRLPEDYDSAAPHWLIFAVHGGGSDGRTFWLADDLMRASEASGFDAIVVAPTFPLEDANAQRFPSLGLGALARRILDDAKARYAVQPAIFVTGYSRGGQFAHRFVLAEPDGVKACAPLAAGSWTTPDGRFLNFAVGPIDDPAATLAAGEAPDDIPEAQRTLYDPRVAQVAATPAHPDAQRVPFLVMCGALDERFDTAKEFAASLALNGYEVQTRWPQTAHGGRNDPARQAEFEKYPATVIAFFQRTARGE